MDERRRSLLWKLRASTRLRDHIEEGITAQYYACFQKYALDGESKAPHRYVVQYASNLAYSEAIESFELRRDNLPPSSEEAEVITECLKGWRQLRDAEEFNFRLNEYKRVLKRAPRTGTPLRAAIDRFFENLARFKFSCAYCNGRFDHVDHFIPLEDDGANDESNLLPACQTCNLSKGDKEPMEWCFEKFGSIGFYWVRRAENG